MLREGGRHSGVSCRNGERTPRWHRTAARPARRRNDPAKSAEEKVAALILLIMRRMQAPGHDATARTGTARFELPLSRTEMADYLGLRIETVSRQLAHLRNTG